MEMQKVKIKTYIAEYTCHLSEEGIKASSGQRATHQLLGFDALQKLGLATVCMLIFPCLFNQPHSFLCTTRGGTSSQQGKGRDNLGCRKRHDHTYALCFLVLSRVE